jgi:hypothetical protein
MEKTEHNLMVWSILFLFLAILAYSGKVRADQINDQDLDRMIMEDDQYQADLADYGFIPEESDQEESDSDSSDYGTDPVDGSIEKASCVLSCADSTDATDTEVEKCADLCNR